MNELSRDPAQFFRTYVALSKGMRFEEKRAWWDEDEPLPLLKPEESAVVLLGWAAIQSYWTQTRGLLRDLSSSISDIETSMINHTLAISTFRLRWTAHIDGPFLGGAPLGALVRVTAATRLKPQGWRIFSYLEAHVDPVTYARKIAADRAVDLAGSGFGDRS